MEEEKDRLPETETETPEETALTDNDEDIDAYIRTLTASKTPEPPEEKPEEKEPEREMFRVTSQIGEDDYRAFIWFSTLLRRRWILPVFLLIPIVTSVSFSFDGEGNFFLGNLVISLVLVFLAMTGIVVFRCTRWMSRIRKKTPERLMLTDTTLIFMTESVVNIREGSQIRVPYTRMTDVHESRKRFIMYFDNGKSMLFRKEDMPDDTLAKFRPFIRSKAHPKNVKNSFGKK